MQLLYLVGVLLMTFNLLTCVHSQSMSLTLLDKLGARLEDFYVFIFMLIDSLNKLVLFNLHEYRLCGWSCKSTVVMLQISTHPLSEHEVMCTAHWPFSRDYGKSTYCERQSCVPLLLLNPSLMRFSLDI